MEPCTHAQLIEKRGPAFGGTTVQCRNPACRFRASMVVSAAVAQPTGQTLRN